MHGKGLVVSQELNNITIVTLTIIKTLLSNKKLTLILCLVRINGNSCKHLCRSSLQRYLKLTKVNQLKRKDLRKTTRLACWNQAVKQCHLKVNQVTNHPLSLKICIPKWTLSCSIHLKGLQNHEENSPTILHISMEEPCTFEHPKFCLSAFLSGSCRDKVKAIWEYFFTIITWSKRLTFCQYHLRSLGLAATLLKTWSNPLVSKRNAKFVEALIGLLVPTEWHFLKTSCVIYIEARKQLYLCPEKPVSWSLTLRGFYKIHTYTLIFSSLSFVFFFNLA